MLSTLFLTLSFLTTFADATPCNDGWESPSSGSGTCSHHGGIAGGSIGYYPTYPTSSGTGYQTTATTLAWNGYEIGKKFTPRLGHDCESVVEKDKVEYSCLIHYNKLMFHELYIVNSLHNIDKIIVSTTRPTCDSFIDDLYVKWGKTGGTYFWANSDIVASFHYYGSTCSLLIWRRLWALIIKNNSLTQHEKQMKFITIICLSLISTVAFAECKTPNSSWISMICHNGSTTTATMSGTPYTFCGISSSTFNDWVNSPSAGTYYHNYIRDRYHCWTVLTCFHQSGVHLPHSELP